MVDEPFSRVAIDSVGPLPRVKSGNKYMLTHMSHGTKYPEVIPFQKADATTVAEALMDTFFPRVGVPPGDPDHPRVKLSMEEWYYHLGVKHLKTSPYCAQTNRAIERFHGTLKQMTRNIR